MAKQRLFSIQNLVGILLAILIIFDLKIEKPIIQVMNTPIGIIFSIIFVIILFICMNPIVGILFLIYLFINIRQVNVYDRNKKLKDLNQSHTMQVEEEIILMKAPIKNQNQGNNVSFQPMIETLN